MVRDYQEDAFLHSYLDLTDDPKSTGVVIMADGMGGTRPVISPLISSSLLSIKPSMRASNRLAYPMHFEFR